MRKQVTLNDVFGEDGALAEFKEGYKPRHAQIEASEKILQALINNSNAIIEGGTGIGKSFAYLFPTLMSIADSNFKKKAILVTSGISLQEQLIIKDLPFAVEVMKTLYPEWKTNFKYTLLKGRQNFLCLEKINELGINHLPKAALSSNYHEISDFVKNTKTGDLSDMDVVLASDVLETVACTKRAECKSKECPYYNECFYTKHRATVNESSIIVTNYHMLFSDIKVGGTILPDYDILVFDEAHESANIFRDFDSEKISVNTILNIRNKISELTNKTKMFVKELSSDIAGRYINEFEIAFHELREKYPDLKSPITIDSKDMLPQRIYDLSEKLMPLLFASENAFERLKYLSDSPQGKDEFDNPVFSEEMRIVRVIVDTLVSIIEFLNGLKNRINDENEVVFIEDINDSIILGNKKIEVGEKLNSVLFEKENLSCIFTSATISVGGNFDYIKEQIGIKFNSKETIEFIANSPFDLTNQQLWYLPPNICNGNALGFDDYALSNMLEISEACQGGVLCLFTSIRNMRNAKMKFEKELGHKYRILSQGDMPKSKLIKEFSDDRDSILLGTKSFFTGIDVPGDSLRGVIIDKFPFAQPTDPVQQKLKLKDNAFFKYSIPDMVILLKQAVGRGVRSVNDKCVVSILDGRISTARYKTRIFNSFNYKKTSTRNVDDIKSFFR